MTLHVKQIPWQSYCRNPAIVKSSILEPLGRLYNKRDKLIELSQRQPALLYKSNAFSLAEDFFTTNFDIVTKCS